MATLRKGSTGQDVRELQTALNGKGYTLSVDGFTVTRPRRRCGTTSRKTGFPWWTASRETRRGGACSAGNAEQHPGADNK